MSLTETPSEPEFPTSLPVVGMREIAMAAGVTLKGVNNWISRKQLGFPEPLKELEAGGGKKFKVWWWPAVRQWLIETGRETNAGWTLEQIHPTRGTVDRTRMTNQPRSA